jgi:CheY-like chemotaxis protein
MNCYGTMGVPGETMEMVQKARERVLVVEDEELIRLMLVEVLDDEGFEVFEASTGDEAAKLIENPDGFQAVVTDIHMPGERDGIAVGRHARRRHPGIPIIYCTGRPDVLSGAETLGHRDVLVRKPYVPSQVVVALRRFLPSTGDAD